MRYGEQQPTIIPPMLVKSGPVACSEQFAEPAAIADALGKRRVTLDGDLVCLRSDGRPRGNGL